MTLLLATPLCRKTRDETQRKVRSIEILKSNLEIDGLGVGHREIIDVIQSDIHRLQRIVKENFARVERSEND